VDGIVEAAGELLGDLADDLTGEIALAALQ
jgi:hypothetical protein